MPYSSSRPDPTFTTLGISPFPPIDREFGKKYTTIEYINPSNVRHEVRCLGDNLLITTSFDYSGDTKINLGARVVPQNSLLLPYFTDVVVIEVCIQQPPDMEEGTYILTSRLNKAVPAFRDEWVFFILDDQARDIHLKIIPQVLDQYKYHLKIRYHADNQLEFPFRSIVRGDFESKHYGTVSQAALDKVKRYLVNNVLSYRGEKLPYHIWKANLDRYVTFRLGELEGEFNRWSGSQGTIQYSSSFANQDFFKRSPTPMNYNSEENFLDTDYSLDTFTNGNNIPQKNKVIVEGREYTLMDSYVHINLSPYFGYVPMRNPSVDSHAYPTDWEVEGFANTIDSEVLVGLLEEYHEGDAYFIDAIHRDVYPTLVLEQVDDDGNPLPLPVPGEPPPPPLGSGAKFTINQSGTEYHSIEIVNPGLYYKAGDILKMEMQELYTIHLTGKTTMLGVPIEVEPDIPNREPERSFIYNANTKYFEGQLVKYNGLWYRVMVPVVLGVIPTPGPQYELHEEGHAIIRIRRLQNQPQSFELVDIVSHGKGYRLFDEWVIKGDHLGKTFCQGVTIKVMGRDAFVIKNDEDEVLGYHSDGKVLAVTVIGNEDYRYWDLRYNRDIYQIIAIVEKVDEDGGILELKVQHPEQIEKWKLETDYKAGQIIEHNDILYKCVQDHKNVEPTDLEYYERIREKVLYQQYGGPMSVIAIDYTKRWPSCAVNQYWNRPKDPNDTLQWMRYPEKHRWIGNARPTIWPNIKSEIIGSMTPIENPWTGPVFHVTKVSATDYHLDMASGSAVRGTVLRIRGVQLNGESPKNDLYILAVADGLTTHVVVDGETKLTAPPPYQRTFPFPGGDENAFVTIGKNYSQGKYFVKSIIPGTGYEVNAEFDIPGNLLNGETDKHDCKCKITSLITETDSDGNSITQGQIAEIEVEGLASQTWTFYGIEYTYDGTNFGPSDLLPRPANTVTGSWYTEQFGENGEFDLYFPEYPGNNIEGSLDLPVYAIGKKITSPFLYGEMLRDLEHHVTQLKELKYDYSNFDDILMRDWLYLKVSNPLTEPLGNINNRALEEHSVFTYLPTKAETGSGSGCVVHVEIISSVITKNQIIIVEKGTGYKIDDIFIVNGHFLGGKHNKDNPLPPSENSLYFRVTEVNATGGVVDYEIYYSNVVSRSLPDEQVSLWPYYNELYIDFVNLHPYDPVPEYNKDKGYSRLAHTYLVMILDKDVPFDQSNPDFLIRDKWKTRAILNIAGSEGAANADLLIASTTGQSQQFAQGLITSPFSADYLYGLKLLVHTDRPMHGPLDPRIVSGIDYFPKTLKGQPNHLFVTEFKFTPIRLLLRSSLLIRGQRTFYIDTFAYDHLDMFLLARFRMMPGQFDTRLTYYAANPGSPKNSVTTYYGKIISKEFPDAEIDLDYD